MVKSLIKGTMGFWVMTPCSFVGDCRRSERRYHLSFSLQNMVAPDNVHLFSFSPRLIVQMGAFSVFHCVVQFLCSGVSEERTASIFRTTNSGSNEDEVTLKVETILSSEAQEQTKYNARCKDPQHHPYLIQHITSYGSIRRRKTEDYNIGASLTL